MHARRACRQGQFLDVVQLRSLQKRWVTSLTSIGAHSCSCMVGFRHPFSSRCQPCPTGSGMFGFGMSLWHHTLVCSIARRTCCLNACSVGGNVLASLSVVDAKVYLSSSRSLHSFPFCPYSDNTNRRASCWQALADKDKPN